MKKSIGETDKVLGVEIRYDFFNIKFNTDTF